MRARQLIVLLLGLALTNGYITLKGACYPCDTSNCCDDGVLDESSMREKGNVWKPASPGGNQLPCGGWGNQGNIATRLLVEPGTDFKIHYTVHKAPGGGKLSMALKYGKDPNFHYPGEELLVEPLIIADEDGQVGSVTVQIGKPGFNGTATIQVSHQTADTNITYHQCLDLKVNGADKLPPGVEPLGMHPVDGPWIRGVKTLPEEGGWKLWHTIVILLIAFLCICGIIAFLYFQGRNKDDEDVMEVQDPQMELDEQVQSPQEPEVEDPPKEITPEQAQPEREPTPEGMPVESPPDEENPVVAPNAGAADSSGRHFHFRYVDKESQASSEEDES